MQIPIVNGIYTDENADFRTSYPLNYQPVPKAQGISKGYLRPAPGVVSWATGQGIDRGAINWNGLCYRASGTRLVRVNENGTVTNLGDIGASSAQVSFDYSFDRLAIVAGGDLYYYNGATLSQVTDPDLGTVLDVIWVDGYFMTTDGTYIVVTELSDPTSVLPTKYGSSEADPDDIKALLKIRNEPYAINRYTIEAFQDIGGSGFPFQRIDGAQIQRGSIGTHTCCVFGDAIAFMGGGRNETTAVWLGVNGGSVKISTREIDQILKGYTDTQLAAAVVEARFDEGHQLLYVHLPDRTLVYDQAATQEVGEQVWFVLCTGVKATELDYYQYKARNFVWCYNKWIAGDPTSSPIGYLSNSIMSHWGQKVTWEFGTQIVFNQGLGAIFHNMELIALTGRVAVGTTPKVWTQYSTDGEVWSTKRFINAGTTGDRLKRLMWLQQGHMRNWRVQRFGGDSDAFITTAFLSANLEALAV